MYVSCLIRTHNNPVISKKLVKLKIFFVTKQNQTSSTGFQLYPWEDIIIPLSNHPENCNGKDDLLLLLFRPQRFTRTFTRSREISCVTWANQAKEKYWPKPTHPMVVGKNFSGFSCVFLCLFPLSRDCCESRKKVSLREKNTFPP